MTSPNPDHLAQDLNATIVIKRLVIVTTYSAELGIYVNQRKGLSFVVTGLFRSDPTP